MTVLPFQKTAVSGNGGNGGKDLDERLRHLETSVVRIETEMKRVALREDVLNLKLWILAGVIGGMLIAVSLGLAIAKVWA